MQILDDRCGMKGCENRAVEGYRVCHEHRMSGNKGLPKPVSDKPLKRKQITISFYVDEADAERLTTFYHDVLKWRDGLKIEVKDGSGA